MKKVIIGSLALVFCFASITTYAEDSEWETFYDEAGFSSNQTLYTNAVVLAKQKLQSAEQEYGLVHPNVALRLNNLALLYIKQGQQSKAEPLLMRALAINENTIDPGHRSEAVTILNNLASYHSSRGEIDPAMLLFYMAMFIEESAHGRQTGAAMIANNIAGVFRRKGLDAAAGDLYRSSLAILESNLGENDPKVALVLNNLASLYNFQQDYLQAESLYMRSLAIKENVFGPAHPAVALTMDNLADLYIDMGQIRKADALKKRVTDIYAIKQ